MRTKPLRLTHRSLPLLLGLIVMLVVFPFLPQENATRTALRVMYAVVIVAGIYAVSARRLTVIIAVVLALPAIASQWIPDDVVRAGPLARPAFGIVVHAFIGSVVFAHVMRSSTLVIDKILGAITAYLLVGMMFADMYALLELIEPGSLRLATEPGQIDREELLYFSFTTLTTLGYGDITPITQRARVLTSFEATFGVLYIAVLIARLVGSSHHQPPPGRGDGKDERG